MIIPLITATSALVYKYSALYGDKKQTTIKSLATRGTRSKLVFRLSF